MLTRVTLAFVVVLALSVSAQAQTPIFHPILGQTAAANDPAAAATYTTSPFSVESPGLVLLTVVGVLPSGTGVNTPAITCHDATWELVNSREEGDPARAVFVFRTESRYSSVASWPPELSTEACQIDFNGQTQARALWSVAQWRSVDPSGAHGSGAIAGSLTAAARRVWLRERGSVTFAAFYVESDTLAAPAPGWTTITNPAAVEGSSLITITQETTRTDTPPSITHEDAPAMIGVAVGIKPQPRPLITFPRPLL